MSHGPISRFLLRIVTALLLLYADALAQGDPHNNYKKIPSDFRPKDPELDSLMEAASTTAAHGSVEDAIKQARAALALCEKKGLVLDCALIKSNIASGLFALGKWKDSAELNKTVLSVADQFGNDALAADVLVSLAAIPKLDGNLPEALRLTNLALERARKSGNLFVQSRVLGELAITQLTSDREAAEKAINEAVEIDRQNSYDWIDLHLVYQANVWLANPKLDDKKATSQLNAVLDPAVKNGESLVAVFAIQNLANIYVRQKNFDLAIGLLENALIGKVTLQNGVVHDFPELKSASGLPVFGAVLRGLLSDAYRASGRREDAIRILKGLLAYTNEFKEIKGGAAFELGKIYIDLHEDETAIAYLTTAASAWRELNYKGQLRITLATLADLLAKLHKNSESLPVLTEMVAVANETDYPVLAIIGQTNLARAFHALGREEDAEKAFVGALKSADQAYSHHDVDRKAIDDQVFNLYLNLFDFDRDQKNLVFALGDVERALFVADISLNSERRQQLFSTADNLVNLLKLQESSESFYQQGKYMESLTCSELLDALDRLRTKFKIPTAAYNNKYLFDIPFKLATSEKGATDLADNLLSMGELAGIARRVGYDALLRYYIRQRDFQKAKHFGDLARLFVTENADKPIQPDVEFLCLYAYAAEFAGDQDSASHAVGVCEAQSDKLQPTDERLVQAAKSLKAQVLAVTDPARSQEAIEWLLGKSPSDPEQELALGVNLGRQGKHTESLDFLNRAVSHFASRGDKDNEARARLELGRALMVDESRSKQSEGMGQLEESLKLFGELKDNNGIFQARCSLGDYYDSVHQLDKALAQYRIAYDLAESSKDAGKQAYAISRSGFALYNGGRKEESLAKHMEAARLYRFLANPEMESIEWTAIGGINKELGQPEEAKNHFTESTKLADATSNYDQQISSRLQMGFLSEGLGAFGEAVASYRQAESIAKQHSLSRRYAACAYLLSWSLTSVGEWREATQQGNLSLSVAHDSGNTDQEFLAIELLMNIYSDRRSGVKSAENALRLLDRAKELAQANPQLDVSSLEDVLVELYLQLGKYTDAESSARRSVSYYQGKKNREGEASSLLSLSEVQRKRGDVLGSRASLNKAKQLNPNPTEVYTVGRFYYQEAGLLRAEGHIDAAIGLYERIIGLINTISSSIGSSQERTRLTESYSFIYEELIATLFEAAEKTRDRSTRASFAEKALRYSEANKAREFSSSWGATFIRELKKTLPAELQEKQQRLFVELNARTSDQADRNSIQSSEVPLKNKAELSELSNALWKSYPSYASLVFPKSLVIPTIPLRSNETLVSFKVTDEGTFVWILAQCDSGVCIKDFYKTEITRDWLRSRVSAIRAVFNRASPEEFAPQESLALFKGLFPQDHARDVIESRELIVIPDDALFLIPFEMLASSASPVQYPLLKKPIHYFPSLVSTTISRAAEQKSIWPQAFFGLADPSFQLTQSVKAPNEELRSASVKDLVARGFTLDPLPGTRAEVLSIVPMFAGQGVETRFGTEATKKSLLNTDLGRFRFLHFATHGLMPAESSLIEPALVLSNDPSNPNQIFLQLSEILSLHLRAESVVLSACNTGSGDISKAEGVSNLGRAFLMAGAQSAVVSLWSVADDSTALLMQKYYANILKGQSKAEALASARADIAGDPKFASPFYWAAFVLMGD